MTVDYLHRSGGTPTKALFTQQLIESPPPVIAVDVETISLNERMPIGFGIAATPDDAWYFKTYPEYDPEIDLVLPLLRNPAIKKVMHNAMFDLREFPLIADDVAYSNIADTNVMARILGRVETKLAFLYDDHRRPVTPAKTLLEQTGVRGATMLDVEPIKVAVHCMEDCMATYALYQKYAEEIHLLGLDDYFAIEMEAMPILVDMSLRGIHINQYERQEFEDALTKEVGFYREYCEKTLPSHLRFSPSSNQQCAYVLSARGNFLPFTKGSRKPGAKKNLSTAEEVLEGLDDPLAAMIINFRKQNKLLTTYIMPLRGEDRAYTNYNFDAVVGRISSSDFNMQNIPGPDSVKKSGSLNMRNMYMPDSGIFTTGDFSQEHLRILCYLSGDKEMERVYLHGEFDGDIHIKTAKECDINRQMAKTLNYAIPYGATAQTIDQQGKFHNIRKATRLLDGWFRAYPQAYDWLMEAQRYGMRHHWSLPTLFGRSIYLPEEGNSKSARDAMLRKAVNYPILGTDGEVMKRALIKSKHLPLAVTVHDSLTADGNVEFPIEELENITPFRLPFEVKKTLRWE